LKEGDSLNSEAQLSIIHVPGHTSLNAFIKFCFGQYVVELLFLKALAETTFRFAVMKISAGKTKFYTLPDEYTVYAGHMEPTTIGYERKNNPFINNGKRLRKSDD
jgi:glyoxylase-like metal-dependent hydrolase (beta-lactamase superfamily II)